MLLRSALIATDKVIIPIECSRWAIAGVHQLEELISQIKKRDNPKLEILNKYNVKRILEQTYKEKLCQIYGNRILKTIIKDKAKYIEASALQQPISFYASWSEEASAFRELADEVLQYV